MKYLSSIWSTLSNIGTEHGLDESFRRQIILSNQINVFVFLIFTLLIVVALISFPEVPIIDIFSEVLVCICAIVSLFMNKYGLFRLTRLIMLTAYPFLIVVLELILVRAYYGAYFWLPYIPVAVSLGPYLLFDIYKEMKTILILESIYFVLTIGVKTLISWNNAKYVELLQIVNSLEPFYSMVPLLLFFIGNLAMYYTLKLSKDYETRLLVTNEALTKAGQTKDKFFRIIGHDLKSPIDQMIQVAGILDNPDIKLTDGQIKELMKAMRSSSSHGLKLLENLLEWSLSQTESISFRPGPLNFYDLCVEVLELYRSQAEKKQLVMKINGAKDLVVLADQNMIHTTLRNLVSNAIKFSRPGGCIVVNFAQKSDHFQFEVKDDGVGMSQEISDGLFKFGELASMPGTNNEKGTGIGLVLVKEFIDKHEGTITVHSTPDVGTTFGITLPLSYHGFDPSTTECPILDHSFS